MTLWCKGYSKDVEKTKDHMDICNQKLQKDVQSIVFSQDSYEGFFFLYIRFEQHKTGHAFLSVTHGPWRFWSNTPAKVLVYITLTSFQLKAILAYLRKHWVLALLTFWNTCTRWHLFSKRNKQTKKTSGLSRLEIYSSIKTPLGDFTVHWGRCHSLAENRNCFTHTLQSIRLTWF